MGDSKDLRLSKVCEKLYDVQLWWICNRWWCSCLCSLAPSPVPFEMLGSPWHRPDATAIPQGDLIAQFGGQW